MIFHFLHGKSTSWGIYIGNYPGELEHGESWNVLNFDVFNFVQCRQCRPYFQTRAMTTLCFHVFMRTVIHGKRKKT